MELSKKKNLNKVLEKSNDFDLKKMELLRERMEMFSNIIPDGESFLNEAFIKQSTDALMNGVFDKAMFKENRRGIMGFDVSKSLIMEIIRGEYIRHYGFVALNNELINDLANLLKDKKIVDAGAGNGFLSSKLKEKNIDVTPVDHKVVNNDYVYKKNYCEIVDMDAVKFLELNKNIFDTVLLSWPPMNSFAHNILKSMSVGQKLIYIGERGGCTADDSFFDLLDVRAKLNIDESNLVNKNFTNFPSIRDAIYIYDVIQ